MVVMRIACLLCIAVCFLIPLAHCCYPGAFIDTNGTCTPCPRGMYSLQGGAQVCFSCPRGSFASNEGASQCELSGMGAYVPNAGQSHSTPCDEGTFQFMGGTSTCLSCIPGQYQPLPGATVCEECAPGYSQSGYGARSCRGCLEGTYASCMGATGCSKCSKGHYQSALNTTFCSVCQVGTFQARWGATQCLQCPPGTYSADEGGTGCTSCAPGHFSGGYGVSSCQACPVGSHQALTGSSFCDSCEKGKYGDLVGLTGAEECKPCSAGRYSSGEGMTSNSDCPLCPQGTFSGLLGVAEESSCQSCPSGTTSSEDRAHCLACPYGTLCPVGSYAPILCKDDRLVCDGRQITALPGFIPILMDQCTGVLECPEGTRCYERYPEDQGVFPGWVEMPGTYFVIITEGEGPQQHVELSCPEPRRLAYSSRRMDPGDQLSSGVALFTLLPLECPSGTFMEGSVCSYCFAGTFSSAHGAFTSSTCHPCPTGHFSSMLGATACTGCLPGTYQAETGTQECILCQSGAFQPLAMGTACDLCQAGTYTEVPGSSSCVACDAGWAQPENGSTLCHQCNSSEYSSVGDSSCSTCSQSLDRLEGCPALDQLPVQLDGMWLTVRGVAGDECAGIGRSTHVQAPPAVRLPVQPVLTRDVRCAHTLSVMGRPQLSRAWTTSQQLWQRPVSLRVLPFGNIVHTEFCQQEGLGAAFVVQDDLGGYETDLTGAEAVLRVTDPSSQALLFWAECERLPTPPAAFGRIPWGYCHTRQFCPTSDVTLHIVLSWAGGNSVEAESMLTTVGAIPCPPSPSWIAMVNLEHPGIPQFTGDEFAVVVSVQNSPSALASFRFSIRLFSGFAFLTFESGYAASHTIDESGQILSVEGDATQGVKGGIGLGRLSLRVDMKVSEIMEVLQVVPGSFRVTLTDGVEYKMLVKTQGYTCRGDGGLDMLLEFERAASLVALPSLPRLVFWEGLQAGGWSSPIKFEVLGIWNRQGMVGPVTDMHCSTNDHEHLQVDSCDRVVARGTGRGGVGKVQVKVLAASTFVSIPVLFPGNVSVTVIPGLDGLSGRFKVFTRLKQGHTDLFGVDLDATPYLGDIPSSGVMVQGEEWTCSPLLDATSQTFFTVGLPVLFEGTCQPSPALPQPSFLPFLFTGGRTGVSSFAFGPSVLQPASPQGTILFFSEGLGLPLKHIELGINPGEHGGRVGVDSAGAVFLQNLGLSPRCVKTDAGVRLPVLPASPHALDVLLSTHVLVTQHDMWGLMPMEVRVTRAFVSLSDGSRMEVTPMSSLVPETQGDLDIVPGEDVIIRSRATAGNFTITFSLAWAPCLEDELTVQVYPYSVESSRLVCATCPSVLTMQEDPLASLFPDKFPSSILESAFSVMYALVDGTTTERAVSPMVRGGLAAGRGVIFGVGPGMGEVFAAGVRNGLQIPVISRWAKSCELLCNALPCSSARLTVPGDGASAPPFSYSAELEMILNFTLFDGTHMSTPLLDGMYLQVNGSQVSTQQGKIELRPGILHVTVSFSDYFGLDPVSSGNMQVATLESLVISGPSVLFQVHCSRIWEIGHFTVTGILSDGERGQLPLSSLWSDGIIIRPTQSPGSFWATGSGTGWVRAAWNWVDTSVQVMATVSSKYVESVTAPQLPDVWTAAADQAWSLQGQLTPAFEVNLTELVWARVMRWTSSVPGVVKFGHDFSHMTLLSDFFRPISLSCILRGCMTAPPQVISVQSMGVNLFPSKSGQIDLGEESGMPLPLVEIGGVLSIPVFIFGETRLQAYAIDIVMDGVSLLPVDCTGGELLLSQCLLSISGSFQASADFPSSQRTGRVLVSEVRGRVMLDTLSTVSVLVKHSVFDGVEQAPRRYTFSVRTGQGDITPHQPSLNRVVGPDNPILEVLNFPGENEPNLLEVCCGLTVAKKSSELSDFLPFAFGLQTIMLQPGNFSLNIMDPRISIKFDRTLLAFQDRWWVLEDGAWPEPALSSAILVTYTHPGTLNTLHAQFQVRLAVPARLEFVPASLKLKRIHCSPDTFQSRMVMGTVVLQGGLKGVPLLLNDGLNYSSDAPSTAQIYLSTDQASFHVQGVSPGTANISVEAHGVSGSIPVLVLEDSVLFESFGLENPLLLRACLGQAVQIPFTAELPEDSGSTFTSLDGIVNASLVSAVGPVTFQEGGLSLVLQGNTLYGDITSHVHLRIPPCQNTPETILYSRLQTQMNACVNGKQQADLEVTLLEDRFRLTLVGRGIVGFFVQIQTDKQLSGCQVLPQPFMPSDCAFNSPSRGGVIAAGMLPGLDRVDIALVQGSPVSVWGFVEVYSNISAVRWPITAGRYGGLQPEDPVRTLMPDLPVVDTAALARAPPGDAQAFILQLMTHRQRLVDFRYYASDRELSLMFRVTDRFLRPDAERTQIMVVIRDPTMPRLPNGTVLEGGGQKVPALPVEDGWYAVQWQGVVPALTLVIEFHVSTDLSLEARTYTPPPLITGTPFHGCPRSAQSVASFLSVYRLVLPSQEFDAFIAPLVCRVHVVARRIRISEFNSTTGQGLLSIALESFIRVQQVHEVIMSSQFSESIMYHKLIYINDTGDGLVACPPGMYFTQNGTYQALPLHAEAREDCYGMVCNAGYKVLEAGETLTCVPDELPLDVVWICVIAILSVVVLVCAIIFCVKFARSNSKKRDVVIYEDHTVHGMSVIMGRPQGQDVFNDAIPEHVWGAEEVMDMENVQLDDYSSMILDDPLTPVKFGEFRR